MLFLFGFENTSSMEGTLKTTDQMTYEERISTFGYDPLARNVYIGTSSPVRHRGEDHKFDFYYNASTKAIDVCYSGCNGTYMKGREIPDNTTTLPIELSKAFFEVKWRVPKGYSFHEKKWLGRIVVKNYKDEYERAGDYGLPVLTGKKTDLHFDIRYDLETRSLDAYYIGCSSPHIRAIVNQDGSSTLPSEVHKALQGLLKNPQSSVDDHNARCEECFTEKSRNKNYNPNNY